MRMRLVLALLSLVVVGYEAAYYPPVPKLPMAPVYQKPKVNIVIDGDESKANVKKYNSKYEDQSSDQEAETITKYSTKTVTETKKAETVTQQKVVTVKNEITVTKTVTKRDRETLTETETRTEYKTVRDRETRTVYETIRDERTKTVTETERGRHITVTVTKTVRGESEERTITKTKYRVDTVTSTTIKKLKFTKTSTVTLTTTTKETTTSPSSTSTVQDLPQWTYDLDDPDEWVDLFTACAGQSQSPINIKTSKVVSDSNLKPIEFVNYDVSYLFNFTNSVQRQTIIANPFLDDITGIAPYITGSNFGTKFFLKQFHFHWGSSPSTGSEHQLNGKSFAGELHLVHQSEAGAFAVVGFFLETTGSNNTRVDKLIQTVGTDARQRSISTVYLTLTNILPDLDEANEHGYFRYIGSLTTPPCTEGIIWNVYKKPIQVSFKQIQAFYRNDIKFNYRPVQKLNGRTVYSSVCDD